MASYVDSNLMAGEKVLYRAHTSKWSLLPLVLLGILLLALVVGLFVLAWAWIRYRTTEFAVTDRRVIAKSGLISRRTVEMFLDKVESLNVEQSVAGRIFDYGTVTIRGTGATQEPFGNISMPLVLRKHFMDAADAYRRKA
jgi:uncharacterized membrane protein YdbT with pleckstrin-like domain